MDLTKSMSLGYKKVGFILLSEFISIITVIYLCNQGWQSWTLFFDFIVFNFIFKTSNANLILLSFMTRLSSLWNNHSINIFTYSDISVHYYKTASIPNLSLIPTVLIISKNTPWKSFVGNGTINTILCRDMKIK